MTTYDESAVSNTVIAHKKPITLQQGRALRDNPIAISEAATGAPVVVAGWHPYDMVKIGDGNDGVFYDFAVNGTQATITTPDFADGYEYAICLTGLGCSATQNLVVSLYRETDAAYSVAWTSSNTSPDNTYAWIEIPIPRIAKNGHFVEYKATLTGLIEIGASGFYDATVQKILRARIEWSSGNIDAGTAKLYRRGMQG